MIGKLIFDEIKDKNQSSLDKRRFLKMNSALVLTHKVEALGQNWSITGWPVSYDNKKLKTNHIQHFLLKMADENKTFEFVDLLW